MPSCLYMLALRSSQSNPTRFCLVVGNSPNKSLSTDLLSPQYIYRFLCSFQKRFAFYYPLWIWLDYTLRQHCGHDARLELFTKQFILQKLALRMEQEEMKYFSGLHSSRNASERLPHQHLSPRARFLIRPLHTPASTHRTNL